ncbi:DUF1893 domain-containing protein [Acidaminobacterium chupaoyuni]
MMKQAIEVLNSSGCSCVIEKNGTVLYRLEGIGVKPILTMMREHPEDLKGAAVADKVIGRAAATALILGGAAEVYGRVMSEAGKQRLEEYGIPCSYGQLTQRIDNRDGTDMCPLEKASFESEDLREGFEAMLRFIESKMKMQKEGKE